MALLFCVAVYSFLPSTIPVAPSSQSTDTYIDEVLLSDSDTKPAPVIETPVTATSKSKVVSRSKSVQRRGLARDAPPAVSTLAYYRTSAAPAAVTRQQSDSAVKSTRSRLTPFLQSVSGFRSAQADAKLAARR